MSFTVTPGQARTAISRVNIIQDVAQRQADTGTGSAVDDDMSFKLVELKMATQSVLDDAKQAYSDANGGASLPETELIEMPFPLTPKSEIKASFNRGVGPKALEDLWPFIDHDA